MNQRTFQTAAVSAILVAATYIFAGPATEKADPRENGKGRNAPAAAVDRVSISVDTGDELHFVRPDRVHRVALVLRNEGKQPVRAELSLGVKERSNHPATLAPQGAVEIPAGGELRRPLSPQMIGPGRGIRYVDWELAADDWREGGHVSFAATEPVGVTPGVSKGFVFGNAGLRSNWPADLKERVVRAATIVGAESIRGDSDWMGVQPKAGEWHWERTDATLALLARHGAELQNLVAYGGHEWTKSADTLRLIREAKDQKMQWRYPPRLDAWRPWVRAQAERYRGKVRYYEIWNEPDIQFFQGTPQQYLELLKAGYEEIKAADPDALVMTGGFASLDHHGHNRELLELVLHDGRPFFDLHAHHRHGSFAMLQQQVDEQLVPLRQKFGVTEPLYFNETAMGREYEREYDQAVELPKRLAFAWSRGAAGYHYFTVWTKKGDASSAAGYSMVNWDFTPRPVWVAYNEMARLLRGRRFSHELKLGEGRWGFAFNGKGDFTGDGDGDYALVAWTEDAVLADAPVVLTVGDGAAARVVDLMGNSTSLPVSAGRVVFTVRREPQYLVVENGRGKPQQQGVLIEAARAGAVVPGGAQTVTVRLSNPLDRPATGRLTWRVPAPLAAQLTLTVEKPLPAGGTAEATLRVALPAGERPAGLATRDVVASYRVDGTDLAAEAAIPVALGVRVPAGDFAARPPDFTLDRPADVVNTNDIDPQTHHLTWRGSDDLSAKAWLGRGTTGTDGKALRVRVEVRDDAHRQPYAAAEAAQGDGVLLAVAVPGQDGWFELGLSRGDGGRAAVHSRRSPRGFKGGQVFRAVRLEAQRRGDVTSYDVLLPYEAFGLSDELMKQGLRFSFVVNDLDEPKETAREGYLRLSDGVEGRADPLRFPTVVLD